MKSKPTRKRYGILLLLFISVVINYLDRTNISIAAGEMSLDLGLTKVQMGIIFGAFAWTYATLQIPGGIIVDLIKPRILYPIILSLWSLATIVQGFANSMLTLVGSRLSIGVFEAPSYPCNNKIVTNWFPNAERAGAIATYTSGQFIGMAFMAPLLVVIQDALGWRGLFIFSGVLGLIWAAVWYIFYRDPQNHPKANQAELDHIKNGGGMIESPEKKSKFKWSDLPIAFKYRKLWGVYLGQFCLGGVTIFFLTWFPNYLVEYRGLDFIKSGFLISIPYLAGFFGVLLSGFTSDYLIRKGKSPEIARKVPVLSGMLLSVIIIGANYTDNTFWVMFFLTLAFFFNGFASITWVFVFIGGLAFASVPVIIGYLAKDGNFTPALFFVAGMSILGFLSYTLLVGKVKRIE